MSWFSRKKEDTYKKDLEQKIVQQEVEFQKLLPNLSYTEQVELALNISRNTVSCGPELQFVNELTIRLLEKEYESLTDISETPKEVPKDEEGVPQSSACFYCGKKSRCPYVGDCDDCQITKITDAKWIVGLASFRDSLNNLKRLNEAACNPNIRTAIAELNTVWDLSNLPVLEDQKKG